MALPRIQTALPARRYRFGEYNVTVLQDIESPDPVSYRYLMAYLKDGEQQPSTFVSCELTPPAQRAEGRYQLRVINSTLDEVLAIDHALGGFEHFCEQALSVGQQMLALQDEQAFPLG